MTANKFLSGVAPLLTSKTIRFFLLGIAALAVLATIIYQTDSDARARALADADHALTLRAEWHAAALDRVLQQRMVQVFTFAALPSLRGFAASDENARLARAPVARTELHAIVDADPNLRAASIVDAKGRVILTTDASMLADWSARRFVREALAGRLHASEPARDFGEISQYYTAPILDNAGNVAGALVLRVAVQELWEALGTQPNVLLVDENGVRIADQTNQPQVFVALAPLAPDVAARALAEQRYGTEVTQIRATNLVALADEISRGRATPLVYRDANGHAIHAATRLLVTNLWTVIVFESEDALLAGTRNMLGEMIKVAAIAVIVAFVLALVMQYIFHPWQRAQ